VHVLILSVDTSSPTGSIAVLRDGSEIGVVSTTSDETYSSRIFRQLEFLLAELGLSLASFHLFAVNAGPGSFTGLRVGLSTAKAWADAFSKPVMPVGGLEAVAAESRANTEHIIPLLDARRGQLYAGFYKQVRVGNEAESSLERIEDDAVMSPSEFQAWRARTPTRTAAMLATPSRDWLLALLGADNDPEMRHQIREVSPVLAPTIGRLAYRKSQRGDAVDALLLDANYVRRSDAELNWKGK
jgi:tRNA threonylcarbamoyladenosine biosynthesis protein TsaB